MSCAFFPAASWQRLSAIAISSSSSPTPAVRHPNPKGFVPDLGGLVTGSGLWRLWLRGVTALYVSDAVVLFSLSL